MKTKALLFIFFALSLSVYSQRRDNPNQTQTEQHQIEERKKKAEERKKEFISNFLSTLEGDDFQKQIVKQTVESYFDKKIQIYKTPFKRSVEREDAIKALDKEHFKELKTLISDSDMKKVDALITGEFDEKEVKKKKRKKGKKKRNKD